MKKSLKGENLSFFKPAGKIMHAEVRVIGMILLGWGFAIIGIQLLVWLLGVNYTEVLQDKMTFFNLPLHFWLTGQFLPLWFIALCVVFNLWMDRHDSKNINAPMRLRISSEEKKG